MNKNNKKLPDKYFLCLAKQFYKLRLKTVLKNQGEDAKMLINNMAYMESVYSDCVRYARTHYYKVARFMGETRNVSVKHVDIDYVLEKLRCLHHKMIFMMRVN